MSKKVSDFCNNFLTYLRLYSVCNFAHCFCFVNQREAVSRHLNIVKLFPNYNTNLLVLGGIVTIFFVVVPNGTGVVLGEVTDNIVVALEETVAALVVEINDDFVEPAVV